MSTDTGKQPKGSIALGADHAGFALKEQIKIHLLQMGMEVRDVGPCNDQSVDYPDFAVDVAEAVSRQDVQQGILVCGTGIGMAMAANKVSGVRAAVCHNLETADMSRRHNNANVLALGARVLTSELAMDIVDQWLKSDFEGGRHARRVGKIEQLDQARGTTPVGRSYESLRSVDEERRRQCGSTVEGE